MNSREEAGADGFLSAKSPRVAYRRARLGDWLARAGMALALAPMVAATLAFVAIELTWYLEGKSELTATLVQLSFSALPLAMLLGLLSLAVSSVPRESPGELRAGPSGLTVSTRGRNVFMPVESITEGRVLLGPRPRLELHIHPGRTLTADLPLDVATDLLGALALASPRRKVAMALGTSNRQLAALLAALLAGVPATLSVIGWLGLVAMEVPARWHRVSLFCGVVIAGLCALRLTRPLRLSVGDDGVRIRQGSRTHLRRFPEIAEVTAGRRNVVLRLHDGTAEPIRSVFGHAAAFDAIAQQIRRKIAAGAHTPEPVGQLAASGLADAPSVAGADAEPSLVHLLAVVTFVIPCLVAAGWAARKWPLIVVSTSTAWLIWGVFTLGLVLVAARHRPAPDAKPNIVRARRLRAGLFALLGPIGIVGHFASSRRRGWLRATATTVVVAPVFLASLFAVISTMRAARWWYIGSKIADHRLVQPLGRWDRPVLRGKSVPGNAAEEAEKAFQEIAGLPVSTSEDDQRVLVELVRTHSAPFDRLRASTQRAMAWPPPFERQEAPGAEEARLRVRALGARALARLASSSHVESGECLRLAADIVRIGQDTAAGDGLAPLLLGSKMMSDGAEIAGHKCAPGADLKERETAAHELRLLSGHEVDWGHAFATEALFLARTAKDTAGAIGEGLVDGWLADDLVADATLAFLAEVPRWRSMQWLGYPASWKAAQDIYRARSESENPVVRQSGDDHFIVMLLERQALLRARAINLEARVVEARTGAFPVEAPDAIRAPELCDPFTGTPLLWERAPDGWLVRSVGANGHKDDGEDGDDPRIVFGSRASLREPPSSPRERP